jgi:hypothetical protein
MHRDPIHAFILGTLVYMVANIATLATSIFAHYRYTELQYSTSATGTLY